MAREGAFSILAGGGGYHGGGNWQGGGGTPGQQAGGSGTPGHQGSGTPGTPPPPGYHEDTSKSYEPSDVFCALGSLIAEGRLPAANAGESTLLLDQVAGSADTATSAVSAGSGGSKGGRGYTEGPHVEMPGRISRHKCSSDERLCTKHENFRRHMLLLWQNNVSMSIEVLLCSDCRVGQDKAASLEVTTNPEPGSILLEQWRLDMAPTPGRSGQLAGGMMDYKGLHQAVRSYLHFSQLSAWYNKTGGRRPKNVLVRVTIAGEEFATKFSRSPEEHFFPAASVSHGSTVSVSVRSLPRTEEIPVVICSHNQVVSPQGVAERKATIPDGSEKNGIPESSENRPYNLPLLNTIPGALNWRDPTSTDLRRTIAYNKAKLGTPALDSSGNPGTGVNSTVPDCQGGRLVKSDSMDSILGDSLLDPPQNINKMTPRRYQSPSRCGSPSLEAPEHLMSGSGSRRNVEAWLAAGQQHYTQAPPSYEQALNSRISCNDDPEMFRLNRHDLIRRRDMGLYRGMHPRMIYHGAPRLSLPTHRAALTANLTTSSLAQPIRPTPVLGLPFVNGYITPAGIVAPAGNDASNSLSQNIMKETEVVTDQLPNYCTRSGKHMCDNEEVEEVNSCGISHFQQQQNQNHQPQQHRVGQHSRESSNSSDSIISGSPTGDNYKQEELGVKAKGWTARTGRSATPYGRDSSTDSEARTSKKVNSQDYFQNQQNGCVGGGNDWGSKDIDGELSPAEMDQVLQHLRSRMSPVSGKEQRRPSLKDDPQLESILLHNRISRRSSIDKILEPQGIKVSPQITQVWRAELGIHSPQLHHPSLQQQQPPLQQQQPSLQQQQQHCHQQQQHDQFFGEAMLSSNDRRVKKPTSKSSDTPTAVSLYDDITGVNTVEYGGHPASDLQDPHNLEDKGSILMDAILKHSRFNKSDLQSWIHSAKDTIASKFQPCPTSTTTQSNSTTTSTSEQPSTPLQKETSPVDITTTNVHHRREQPKTDDNNEALLYDYVPQQTRTGEHTQHQTKTGEYLPHHTRLWPDCMKTEDYYGNYDDYAYGQEDEEQHADFYGSHFITDYNSNSCIGSSRDMSVSAVHNVQVVPPTNISLVELCNQLEKKCLISKQARDEDLSPDSNKTVCTSSPIRTRSYSEASAKQNLPLFHFGEPTPVTGIHVLEPLDMSFEYNDSYDQLYESRTSLESSSPPLNDEDMLLLMRTKSEKRRNSIEDDANIPSANKKAAFRKSFDSATSMVFHSRNGLPLTSSPAPMRRGIKFDFDSGISTPKDIKRALFESQYTESAIRPVSPLYANKKKKRDPRRLLSTSAPATVNNNLLGNFEESVLNGRLEPVSTVEGFTAEIGASGSFHPRHLTVPVTVFFYTLCENSNIASPYLGHVNLGKKGYRVPEKGTIQLTLFNPLGTVVKMFVVMYDLTDMPPNSQTFLRQRTLYMPADAAESDTESRKWLRYLIHLRMASSKTGKIYLHTDIRMIIFRKSDLDTASDHKQGKGFELRSFTKTPSNPKFSPRK